MTLATVPSKISLDILSFCKGISPEQLPLYVSSSPLDSSSKGECFSNVTSNLHDGDTSHYGWIIWQTSSHLLQAEFHSVIQRCDGNLECITPYGRSYEHILFLPDPSYPYVNKRVETIYKATSDAKEVQPFIHALETIAMMEEHFSHTNVQSYINLPENKDKKDTISQTIHSMEQAIHNFETMVLKGTGANSPCICGSGKKFKKCCGV